jgi:hypothetical protein
MERLVDLPRLGGFAGRDRQVRQVGALERREQLFEALVLNDLIGTEEDGHSSDVAETKGAGGERSRSSGRELGSKEKRGKEGRERGRRPRCCSSPSEGGTRTYET